VTGDWGRDDVSGQDASLGVGEVGACHRTAGAQLSAAVGAARSHQDLPLGGNVRQNGGYVLLEAIAPVFRPDLWFTATGYYGWGEAQIERNYLNAGLPDTSRAGPNVPTWAVRARVDWQDALRLAGAGFTPYADLSYIQARVDAYTETDGGFPARFDGRTESATQLRLGINAIRPLSDSVRLLGTLEGVHQFNDQGENTTGQVLGLFTFELPGPQYKQNWLRAGIGVDAKLGAGTASLMVNATTEGQDASYWLSASYRLAF
jgi:outer membrane autotransporter protein